jgi:hypothetical protein
LVVLVNLMSRAPASQAAARLHERRTLNQRAALPRRARRRSAGKLDKWRIRCRHRCADALRGLCAQGADSAKTRLLIPYSNASSTSPPS